MYTYTHTHIRREYAAIAEKSMHIEKLQTENMPTKKRKTQLTEVRATLFGLWGHASKSRHLPQLGKAFRQHLLPIHFVWRASKMSQTLCVSSAGLICNVARASNSCIPRLSLQCLFCLHDFISNSSGYRRLTKSFQKSKSNRLAIYVVHNLGSTNESAPQEQSDQHRYHFQLMDWVRRSTFITHSGATALK